MPNQHVKCPKCGQGLMKMVLAASPLTEVPKAKPMQARHDMSLRRRLHEDLSLQELIFAFPSPSPDDLLTGGYQLPAISQQLFRSGAEVLGILL